MCASALPCHALAPRWGEYMRVGETEGAHTLETHELARLLVAIEFGELGDAHWEFAIAGRLTQVELEMVRAGHRPEHELLVVYLNRRVHRVLEVRIVPALFIQIELGDVRRIDVEIPAPQLFVNDKTLKLAAHHRALRCEEREAFTDRIRKRK